MCQLFYLNVPTQIIALNEVLYWFESQISPVLPPKCGWETELALSEAFTNTVRYAHQALPEETPIDIEIEVCGHQLSLKIWDLGQPFDLKAKLKNIQENPQNPLEKESERGLFLMNAIMDQIQSIRIDDRNCLVMHKKF